ncbi:MAG: flippase-like domain-containing protein [Coprobacillus sp.]|nr:flippase-like domain-containing protein [Coprobacillus sp.]
MSESDEIKDMVNSNELIGSEEVETTPNNQEDPKKERKKLPQWARTLIYFAIVILITAGSLVIALWGKFDAVIDVFRNPNWLWLAITIVVVFLMFFDRWIIFYCFARMYTRNYKLKNAAAVDQVGTFYSAVTPTSVGGQFAEINRYHKQGISTSSAVSILAMYSIVSQIVLILYGIIAFAVKFDYIMALPSIFLGTEGSSFYIAIPMWVFVALGFFLNVAYISVILLMAYWKGFHHFIMYPCINLLAKMHIVRNPDKRRESLGNSIENFKTEFRRLMTNIPFFILLIVLFFIYYTIKFSVPYFVGMSLNNMSPVDTSFMGFWDSVLLSNFHQMVTGLIPIPGSAGISEYVFLNTFVNSANPSSGFYYIEVLDELGNVDVAASITSSQALCNSSLVLWRTLTFTLPMLISGIFTACTGVKKKQTEESSATIDTAFPSRSAYYEVQSETLTIRQEDLEDRLTTSTLNRQAVQERLKHPRKYKEKQPKINKKRPKEEDTSTIEIKDDDE